MIEVGEYVRTDNGEIHRVIDIEKGSIKIKSQYKEWIGLCCIAKHNKQLIDLVEVGDYVNGYRVVAIMEDMETGEIHLEMTSDYTNEIIGDCTIYNDDINSIVTHEQFESIEYKVEESK